LHRHGEHRAGLDGAGEARGRADAAVLACRVARRCRVADRASGDHDARVRAEGDARPHGCDGWPRATVRRHRGCRGSDRGPRPRAARVMRPAVLGIVVTVAACASAPATEPADLLITNGTIIDGTGSAPFEADLLVDDGRIVRISRARLPSSAASRVIDAGRLIVAPGFVDLHAHLEPLAEV